MGSIEVEGKSKEEAMAKALGQLGLVEQEVHTEVLEEGRKFLGLIGGQSVRLKVWFDDELLRLTTAKQTLEEILAKMGVQTRVEGTRRDGTLYLNLHSENSGLLIGRHGETIDALQFITHRIVNRAYSSKIRVVVDTEGYRYHREERLRQIATRLAEQVKTSGEAVPCKPMTPDERRIIHLALQGDKDVETSSTGEGALRRVVISRTREGA